MTVSSKKSDGCADGLFAAAPIEAELKRHSARGFVATALSQGAKFAVQLVSQIVLARLLFPAEFGLVAMAYPVIAFLQVFNDIGLGQTVVQRPNLMEEQVSSLFWLNIGISSLLTVIVALLAPLAAWAYAEPRLTSLMIVLGFIFPVVAVGVVPNAIMARHMQFGKMARNEVVALATGAIATILCAMAGLSYWSLLIGQFANALAAIALVWATISWRPGMPKIVSSTYGDVRFGANITLANLATFVTTSGDNMIVGLTSGKISLGLYDRSYNLVVRPIGQMMMPLSRVALPLLSRLADKPEEYCAAYLQVLRISILLIVPAMLVCISDGGTLINVFLGSRWTAAIPIFSWLCVGGLTSGVYASTFWLFITQDRAQELRCYAALGAIINIISYLIGAAWGVVGIAIGSSVGFVFISTPLLLFSATRKGPVKANDVISCVIPFILEAAAIYAILTWGLGKMPITGFIRIVSMTVTSYLLFFLISLVMPANRKLIRAGGRALKGLFILPAWLD